MNKRNDIGGKSSDDAILIVERGSWEIHYSEAERAVLVRTTDYHPGILKLTASDLSHFCGTWESAGINRHRVGDEITLHERRSYFIMAPSHARAIAR